MTEKQDRPSHLKGLAWLILAVGIAVLLAYGISPFVRAIPFGWEKHLGYFLESNPPDICNGSPQQQVLLQKLVSRLYPLERDDQRFSIDVHIVNDPNINAYAELGGKIYLNRGLLDKAQSPEEIAGVLAHEMTHVKKRHILEGFIVGLATLQGLQFFFNGSMASAQWAQFFLHMSFTRSQEAQADRGALIRLQKAHISNLGFGAFFQRLKDMETVPPLLSDHPSSEDRFDMVKNYQNQETTPIMSSQEWVVFKNYCKGSE